MVRTFSAKQIVKLTPGFEDPDYVLYSDYAKLEALLREARDGLCNSVDDESELIAQIDHALGPKSEPDHG